MSESTPPSRTEAIAETLRAQILSGKYEPGERLPSERELAQKTGANRASVREALKQLQQLGMIAIRPGGGARVVPMAQAGLGVLRHVLDSKRPDREFVAQWLDVHELVMAGAARLAMERGTDEQLLAGKKLLRRLIAPSTSDQDFIKTNDELTELIAVASRNVVLLMVRNDLVAQAQKRNEERRLVRPARKLLLPIVADVEQAIDRRDPVAAEEGVRKLLRLGREMLVTLIAGPAEES